MSDIPAMPYATIWGERELVSVANLTRQDAKDFFPIAAKAGVRTTSVTCSLEEENIALEDLRSGGHCSVEASKMSGTRDCTPSAA
jgi:alcohol dehydrogenase, propanol-preferring